MPGDQHRMTPPEAPSAATSDRSPAVAYQREWARKLGCSPDDIYVPVALRTEEKTDDESD